MTPVVDIPRIHGHERYLDKRQIAELLNVSIRWVETRCSRSLPEAQRMPSKMIAGQRRFLWTEVEKWIDRGAAG